jgi:quercetin dioxygenase-like cupin family protein
MASLPINPYGVDFAALPWLSPAPGVRQKSFTQGRTRLRLVEFTDAFVEPEWCRHGHLGYVLSGEFAIDFNGTVHTFRAGDALVIPAGEAHQHRHHATPKPAKLFLVEEI